MQVELLAPAKNKNIAIEAINCGADAIYIGAPQFGARKNVPNSLEDIKEVVEYAHKFWAKVFIALNTILSNSELDEAIDLVLKLSEIGVDALIIQDMGLLERIMEMKISTPIHISTQCDNYLAEKVKFFNEIGVSRVVLARELSLEQIKTIHNENPNLELEAFIHGALCVSMSGQCYLSQFIGGRSANRGECAQPCRKKYTVINTNGEVIKKDFYALCLKDFNASNCLNEMINSGVYSFKIEGRLKDLSYVKNIVSYYRQKLGKGCSSGISNPQFTPNPEKSFNRGFTEYFLRGRTNCFNQESPKSKGEYLGEVIEVKKDCFKLRTDKVIHPQDGIYCKGFGFAVNKVKDGFVYPNNTQSKLIVGDKLWRNYDAEFEKEVLRPVKRQIALDVIVDLDDNNKPFIKLIDEDDVVITHNILTIEKANNPEKMKENFIKQFSKTGESDFYIKEIKISAELPFMPVGEINTLRRELFEILMQERIKIYNASIRQAQGPMKHIQYFQEEVDYRANVHNSYAKQFYEKCGAKVLEPSLETKTPIRRIELMRCKHCIKYALNMCKNKAQLLLRDELGKTYPLNFDCKNCEMKIMSY
ncbi:U32 family peptidase [bacterium]|nr:U32 family peptidase [bacterium]